MKYLEAEFSVLEFQRLSEQPVFIFSAGWRSGSTLLQRLIVSSGKILVWGEPFGDRLPVPRLAESLGVVVNEDSHIRLHERLLASGLFKCDTGLANEWIANLNPGASQLALSQLAFLETLFAAPAQQKGYTRWGCKFVRLSGQHARYLKWLYPNCKVIFLVRHPYKAWLSYKGKGWYSVFPTHRVVHPWSFFSFWEGLASSFQAFEGEKLVVRYEDLIDPGTRNQELRRIGSFVDESLDSSILEQKVGGTAKRIPPRAWERTMMDFLTRSRQRFGYD